MSEELTGAPVETTETPKIYVGQKEVEQVMIDTDANVVGVLFARPPQPQPPEGATPDPEGPQEFDNFTLIQWERVKSDAPYPNGEVTMRRYKEAIREIRAILSSDMPLNKVYKEMFDVLMANRCDIISAGWIMEQVASIFQQTLREFGRRMEDGINASVAKLYGVTDFRKVYLQQIHEYLMEEETVVAPEVASEQETVAEAPVEATVGEAASPEVAPETPEASA